MENICHLPKYQVLIIWGLGQIAYMVLERWLGRTNKLKSASTLDLLQTGLRKVIPVIPSVPETRPEGETNGISK
jgi:hypothetical protein